jgi:hypothetical protein
MGHQRTARRRHRREDTNGRLAVSWSKTGGIAQAAFNDAMGLQGDLKTVPLRDILGWLAGRQASGTLSLSRGRVARRFQLRRGRVMLSTSTEEETLLGRLLIARGLIDPGQLENALAPRDGSRPRLGTALTRAGVVSAAQLRGVLTEKVRHLLVDALAWTDGGFFFDDDGPLPRRPAVSAIVGLADVLALPAGTPTVFADAVVDDVIITDDDIIEIIELTQPRRPPKTPARRRKNAKRGRGEVAAIAVPDAGPTDA